MAIRTPFYCFERYFCAKDETPLDPELQSFRDKIPERLECLRRQERDRIEWFLVKNTSVRDWSDFNPSSQEGRLKNVLTEPQRNAVLHPLTPEQLTGFRLHPGPIHKSVPKGFRPTEAAVDPEDAPLSSRTKRGKKRRRRRIGKKGRKKTVAKASDLTTPQSQQGRPVKNVLDVSEPSIPVTPKKPRGRPKKNALDLSESSSSKTSTPQKPHGTPKKFVLAVSESPKAIMPQKPRGRPRKNVLPTPTTPKRPRGRPRKNSLELLNDVSELETPEKTDQMLSISSPMGSPDSIESCEHPSERKSDPCHEQSTIQDFHGWEDMEDHMRTDDAKESKVVDEPEVLPEEDVPMENCQVSDGLSLNHSDFNIVPSTPQNPNVENSDAVMWSSGPPSLDTPGSFVHNLRIPNLEKQKQSLNETNAIVVSSGSPSERSSIIVISSDSPEMMSSPIKDHPRLSDLSSADCVNRSDLTICSTSSGRVVRKPRRYREEEEEEENDEVRKSRRCQKEDQNHTHVGFRRSERLFFRKMT